jgi:hypothetical protein
MTSVPQTLEKLNAKTVTKVVWPEFLRPTTRR